jgi:hypothetical protein
MLLTLLDNKERVPIRLPGSRRKVPWIIALGIGVHFGEQDNGVYPQHNQGSIGGNDTRCAIDANFVEESDLLKLLKGAETAPICCNNCTERCALGPDTLRFSLCWTHPFKQHFATKIIFSYE